MGLLSKFERDFKEAIQFFPKLEYRKSEKEKMWIVSGELDICDQVGDFWNTFIVAIYLPISYPYCIPKVKEISRIIKREDDWHIDELGECCLDIEHRILILKKCGVNLTGFIKTKVYPYFANQIYKQNKDVYAAGEYRHSFDGIQQFYKEELNIGSANLAIKILQRIVTNRLPGRNDPCICGVAKYKNCHREKVEFLRCLPIVRLKTDLNEFSKLIV